MVVGPRPNAAARGLAHELHMRIPKDSLCVSDMENVEQAGWNNRFHEFCSRRLRLGGWIVLLAIVLGRTHVLLAQPRPGSTTPQRQARLGAERQASSDKNENWRAEPSCFDQATGMAGRAPVSRA